jgi:glucose-6-phosphate 1-dehydrogenase
MDLSQPADYAGLKDPWLDERNADTAVLYLATSPHLFTGSASSSAPSA